jgi:hypothetical protein
MMQVMPGNCFRILVRPARSAGREGPRAFVRDHAPKLRDRYDLRRCRIRPELWTGASALAALDQAK